MSKNWTNDLRRLAEQSEKKAPAGLLDDIKKEMSQRGVRPAYGQRSAHVVRMSVRRWVAVAAIIALVAGVGFHWLSQHPADEQQIAMPRVVNKPKTPVETASPSSGKSLAEQSAGSAKPFSVMQAVSSLLGSSEHAEQQLVAQSLPEPAPTSQSQSSPDEPQAPSTSQREKAIPRHGNGHTFSPADDAMVYESNPRSRSGVVIGAAFSGIPHQGNGLSDMGAMSDAYIDKETGMVHQLQPKQSVKHHHPVTVGLSVRVGLGGRWSLQTGLNYSYLKSDYKVDYGNQPQVERRQHLHYVGVPLAVNYQLWQNRHWNVYVAAGGQAEKLVKGKVSTVGSDEDVKEHRLVWSAQAAAGAEYRLSPKVSVFAEPGASYHFKNGSGVESFYTDKPFNFNINVGLRLNISK